MVPIRVLVLFTIPLIGIFLQRSSSKSMDESNSNIERVPELGANELTRSKRDVDSAFGEDMAESKRAVGDSEPTAEDYLSGETQEIEKRRFRFRRRGGRRRISRRRKNRIGKRRRTSGRGKTRRKPGIVKGIGKGGMGALSGLGTGLGTAESRTFINIVDTLKKGENDDKNRGNDDDGENQQENA